MSGIIKYTILDLNNQYKHLNIICTSQKYEGNKKKLSWKCIICNAEFNSSKNDIDKDFKRCKNCFKLSQLNLAKLFAKNRGGKCLSKVYISSKDKIHFECKNGHQFHIKYTNAIHIGNWCAICSKTNYVSEYICRSYFEQMFGEKFDSIRPNFLKKENGYNLELDGYCAKLNIAFEHQGTHHYDDVFNKLEKTIENDAIKQKICKHIGINLIIIPQLFKKTSLSNLKKYIINQCAYLNITVPFPQVEVDLTSCYNDNTLKQIIFYKELVSLKKGKLLSDFSGVANEKLIWECQYGHRWMQFAYVIKKGTWCPTCSGQKQSKNIINENNINNK